MIFGRTVQISKIAEYYEHNGVQYADVYLVDGNIRVQEIRVSDIRVEDIELY
jgi:hypothetical protein